MHQSPKRFFTIQSVISVDGSPSVCYQKYCLKCKQYEDAHNNNEKFNQRNSQIISTMKQKIQHMQIQYNQLRLDFQKQKESINEKQKVWEMQRCNHMQKIMDLQSINKHLQDNLQSLKQQLSSKDIYILQILSTKIHPQNHNASQNYNNQLVLIRQNEQIKGTITQLKRTLQDKNQEISTFQEQTKKLKNNCKQYKEIILGLEGDLHQQITYHSQIKKQIEKRVQYYQQKQKDFLHRIDELVLELNHVQQKCRNQIKVNNEKWWQINQTMMQKNLQIDGLLAHSQRKELKIQKQLDQIMKHNRQTQIKYEELKSQCAWYLQLLQQAKSNYITSQLSKQSVTAKLQAQKKQLKSQANKLKKQIKVIAKSRGGVSEKDKKMLSISMTRQSSGKKFERGILTCRKQND